MKMVNEIKPKKEKYHDKLKDDVFIHYIDTYNIKNKTNINKKKYNIQCNNYDYIDEKLYFEILI